ncbi:TonB-dependent receptor [Phenylobacterium sp.]|uniref:TonB-dependent receptor n=1 Tax=Phenylobacterium sp. TaxID=1871053 RepID=UPI002F3F1E8B
MISTDLTTFRRRLAAKLCASAGFAVLASASAAAPAAAPSESAIVGKPGTVSELVVTAEPRTEPGAVVGDIKPDLQLAPEDVAAYGVSTITDLLDELAPEIGSNSGRGGEGPAILVNGRRISGFNEIRNLPTEAILRVDILPEEAALKYGFSANQRVVNIVLKPSFGAQTAEAGGGATTAGGAASGQAELSATRIAGEQRFNINLKVNTQSSLTEAQRDVISPTNGTPFDLAGNVLGPTSSGEIDPALSALAGQRVTIAGVPAGVAARVLTLSDFVPTANVPNVTDVRAFRTLVPETQKAALNATLTRPIFADISATVNATFEATSSDAQRGLPGIGLLVPAADPFSPFAEAVQLDRYVQDFGPLQQSADTWTGHLGVSFNRDVASWRLALTGNYDHADNRNANDLGVDPAALQNALLSGAPGVNPFGALPTSLLALRPQDTSHSKSDSGNIQFIASGILFKMPAGPVRTSLRIGASGSEFSSQSQRGGVELSSDLTRSGGNLQASFDVPLTSRKANVLAMFGDINLNANAAVESVSDFGTLTTFGYGVHWTPITGLSILASRLHDQGAPTQQQLGATVLLTPGTRIFDYVTGQTVDVTAISGGNPDLVSDDRYRTSIRVTWQPFSDKQLIFRADYNKIHYKNPIATFPAVTADIEAAFPDRFLRDADGDLTEVDERPLNFASQDVSSLKWGFDYSRPIGPVTAPPPRNAALVQIRRALPPSATPRQQRPPGAPGRAPDGPAPDGGAGQFAGPPPDGVAGAPSGGFGGRGGSRDGRLRISVFHTVYFVNRYLVGPEGPVLDFLNGASLGGLGGQPRHEIQAQINIAERGFGAELNADWKIGTMVRGGADDGASDLSFSGVVKVNARVFADLGRRTALMDRAPWLKGSRVTLSVSNIFDERVEVRDANGVTPLNFQPAYIDPLGRTWRISFRKLFS